MCVAVIRAATYTENFIVSAANKLTIETKAREVEALLVKALYEAKAASDAGAKWENMNEPIMAIRYSQWRWTSRCLHMVCMHIIQGKVSSF